MKTLMTSTTLMMLSAAMLTAQTPAPADTGYTATLRGSWNSVKRYVAASAEKMPEASYGFKPTPEVRSFGELVGHPRQRALTCCARRSRARPTRWRKVDFEKTVAKADLVKANQRLERLLRRGLRRGERRPEDGRAVLADAARHAVPRHAAQRHARQRALRQHDHLPADEGDRSALVDADAIEQRRVRKDPAYVREGPGAPIRTVRPPARLDVT